MAFKEQQSRLNNMDTVRRTAARVDLIICTLYGFQGAQPHQSQRVAVQRILPTTESLFIVRLISRSPPREASISPNPLPGATHLIDLVNSEKIYLDECVSFLLARTSTRLVSRLKGFHFTSSDLANICLGRRVAPVLDLGTHAFGLSIIYFIFRPSIPSLHQ